MFGSVDCGDLPTAGRTQPCGIVAAPWCLSGWAFGVVAGGRTRALKLAAHGQQERLPALVLLCLMTPPLAPSNPPFPGGITNQASTHRNCQGEKFKRSNVAAGGFFRAAPDRNLRVRWHRTFPECPSPTATIPWGSLKMPMPSLPIPSWH